MIYLAVYGSVWIISILLCTHYICNYIELYNQNFDESFAVDISKLSEVFGAILFSLLPVVLLFAIIKHEEQFYARTYRYSIRRKEADDEFLMDLKPMFTVFGFKSPFVFCDGRVWFLRKADALMYKMSFV